MMIVVTGGMGFIGCNFIKHFFSCSSDIRITNIDKIGIGSNLNNLKELESHPRYNFIKADISSKDRIFSIVANADAIVNFAAETHVDRSILNPLPFVQSNIIGTFNLLEAVRKNNDKARFVQISTDEIYGETSEGSFSETDNPNPSNPYSATKASAEMICRSYHKTYGLDINITRCTNNFGPYQFPEKLIPKTIIRALKGLKIPVYGKGENVRDWIYVKDHCEAINLVLEKGMSGEVYNISSGNEIQNVDIVNTILKIMGKKSDLLSFVEDRPGHDFRYSLNSSKIRTELNWKPHHDFFKSLEKTVNWYAQNKKWWEPLATKEILDPMPWRSTLR